MIRAPGAAGGSQGEAVIYASLELYESNGSVEDLLDTFVVSSSILCLYFQSIVTQPCYAGQLSIAQFAAHIVHCTISVMESACRSSAHNLRLWHSLHALCQQILAKKELVQLMQGGDNSDDNDDDDDDDDHKHTTPIDSNGTAGCSSPMVLEAHKLLDAIANNNWYHIRCPYSEVLATEDDQPLDLASAMKAADEAAAANTSAIDGDDSDDDEQDEQDENDATAQYELVQPRLMTAADYIQQFSACLLIVYDDATALIVANTQQSLLQALDESGRLNARLYKALSVLIQGCDPQVMAAHDVYKATQDVEDLVDSLLRIARAAISNSVKQQQQASTATDNDVDIDAVDEDFEDDDGVSNTHVTSFIAYYC
eukprot:5262-Heterococcus_DN1.PRE.2